MTENKRFMIEKSSIVEDGFFICDTTGKFSFPTTKDKSELIMYVKQLNELHEENQALKSDRVRYEEECRLDVFKELYEENEQLKQREQTLLNEIKDFQDLLASKEEVYLKPVIQTIEEAYETERTQIGKNVLKQLIDKMEYD